MHVGPSPRVALTAAVVSAMGACGSLEAAPTRGRIALVVAFAVMVASIVAAALAGKGGDKDGAKPPADAGAGWIVLALLAGVAALIIGTCNTFISPEHPAPPTAARTAPRPPTTPPPTTPPPAPTPSRSCDQALQEADLAFANLGMAQDQARAAAVALDRACRVEATVPAPAPPSPPSP